MNLLASLLFGCLLSATFILQLVHSQQYSQAADSGLHYETGKNHLRGIRRIPYPRYFGRDDNFDTLVASSNELEGRRSEHKTDTPQHVASPSSRQLTGDAGVDDDDQQEEPRNRLAPVAVKPPVSGPAATQRSAAVLAVDKPLEFHAQTNRGAKRLGVEDVVEPQIPGSVQKWRGED
uniref:Secreted protein n=1 Tax=Ditylenchus dipsaci TaxID=166011 RepID=A0A915CRW6_9BILA